MNAEFRGSLRPISISRATLGSIRSSIIVITFPSASRPRRPARPAICVYSPPEIQRYPDPSNLRGEVNTTVFVGMFSPVLIVSVANRTFTKFSWNRSSTISFTRGRRPAWWTPTPLRSVGKMF